MFEVDWAVDVEYENVGQAKERKKHEKEAEKSDKSCRSSLSTTCSRASPMSDRNPLNIFGTLRRKKPKVPSILNSDQIFSIPGSKIASAGGDRQQLNPYHTIRAPTKTTPSLNNVLAMTEDDSPQFLVPAQSKSTIDRSERSGFETPDRSSKESMMSKMTHLTIPTLNSHGVMRSPADITFKTPNPVHILSPDHRQPDFMTEVQHGSQIPSIRRDDSTITCTTTTTHAGSISEALPTTPTQPPSSTEHKHQSMDDEESASELISYWYNSLKTPSRQVIRQDSRGHIQGDNPLLPPTAYYIPMTPTRCPSKPPPLIPPRNSTRLRLRADNPDDWKTPAEWARLDALRAQAASPKGSAVGEESTKAHGQEATDSGHSNQDNDVFGIGSGQRRNTYGPQSSPGSRGSDSHPKRDMEDQMSPIFIQPDTWI